MPQKKQEKRQKECYSEKKEMYEWTQNLKEAYVKIALAEDRGLQIKKNTLMEN